MRPAIVAAALLGVLPFAAHADGLPALDGSAFGPAQAPLLRRDRGAPPDGGVRGYLPPARQGLLFSLGLGGSSLYLSSDGPARIGAADLDVRLGYGFSDRFQMFMDLEADVGTNYGGDGVGSWTWTLRGQTLLIGDRRGNGLNLNLGAGFGGLTHDQGLAGRSSGPTGLALAGGLSFDARITPTLSVSPELFATWHQVPNAPGVTDDVATAYGVRLNLLWYLH